MLETRRLSRRGMVDMFLPESIHFLVKTSSPLVFVGLSITMSHRAIRLDQC